MDVVDEKFFNARIVEREEITNDLWKIRVDPGGEFNFAAGQYATLGVVAFEKHIERAYSIVSSSYEPLVEFFVERVPEGELTPRLHELQAGDTMSLRKSAKGRFTLETGRGPRNHLLLCTVTGIAPFVSFVRTLREDWKQGRFHGEHKLFLVHGASISVELGYREEMERAAANSGWLTYVPTISRRWEEDSWKGEDGRVDDVIRKYTDLWQLSPETTSAYLCGHPGMVGNGKGILMRHGWPKESVQGEVFFISDKEGA